MGSVNYGGTGIPLTLRGQTTNTVTLAPGAVFTLPAGDQMVYPGPYTFAQFKDPISGLWLPMPVPPGAPVVLAASDGANYRLANLTGCAIAAKLTTAGSNYTSVPTVTASAGGSTWKAIMGQVVSSTVTVTSGGANYTLPPVVVFSPPPTGGLPAKGIATISGGVVTGITVTDQGAGYGGITNVSQLGAAPTVTILPNPQDPNLSSIVTATATAALDPTTLGTVTAVVCTSNGNPLTSVPTLSFSSGSAAATAIMCFTVTAQTVSGGTGFTANTSYMAVGGITAGSAVYTTTLNPLSTPRVATGIAIQSAGALTSVTITDGGLFQAVPVGVTAPSALITGSPTISTPTVGGVNDSSFYQTM